MRHAADGFTLIELVLVMLIISFGLVGLASMFGSNVKALTIVEDAQRAAQYGQECAERVIATHRDLGFDLFNTATCDPAPPGGFATAVTVPRTYIGDNTSACPNLVRCRDVSITVTKSPVSSNITLMLVEY